MIIINKSNRNKTETEKTYTVPYKGITLYLEQDAYADNCGTNGGVIYRATAVDLEGNNYNVIMCSKKTQQSFHKKNINFS